MTFFRTFLGRSSTLGGFRSLRLLVYLSCYISSYILSPPTPPPPNWSLIFSFHFFFAFLYFHCSDPLSSLYMINTTCVVLTIQWYRFLGIGCCAHVRYYTGKIACILKHFTCSSTSEVVPAYSVVGKSFQKWIVGGAVAAAGTAAAYTTSLSHAHGKAFLFISFFLYVHFV